MSKSVYEIVTERIIEQLEKGVIPWERPWTGVRSGAYNRISKKPYSILNQMLLQHKGEYATFKQWSELGGKVKKGSKSEIVVFWKIQDVEEENENGEKIIRQMPLLRYYNAFHISQVDGVEPLPQQEFENIAEPIEVAENLLGDYLKREQIRLEQTASNEAYYSPSQDLIHLPKREQFNRIEEYYSTAFHESVHSTGHKSRLGRLSTGSKAAFGSETYSKEELIAEIGSATLMNMLNIETMHSFRNSTAYIQSWLRVLRNDVRLIVSVSSRAEKAVDYIIGVAE